MTNWKKFSDELPPAGSKLVLKVENQDCLYVANFGYQITNEQEINKKHYADEEIKRRKDYYLIIPDYPKLDSTVMNESEKNLDNTGLSARTINCLKANNIHTIEQLCNYTGSDLLKMPNFGRKSYMEILDVLANQFKMTLKKGDN